MSEFGASAPLSKMAGLHLTERFRWVKLSMRFFKNSFAVNRTHQSVHFSVFEILTEKDRIKELSPVYPFSRELA